MRPAGPGPDVLVVGAGPTGLALALTATALGARVRVVERRPQAFRPSRAMVLHPRTLEVLRPLGVTQALLARCDTAPVVRLHLGTRQVTAGLADLAMPDTPFPHLSLARQSDVEAVLGEALAAAGVAVERGTEFLGLPGGVDGGTADGGVPAALRTPSGDDEVRSRFVAGCDGTGSAVRAACGIAFRGGPYAQEVVLADVELGRGPDGGAREPAAGLAHVVAGRTGLLFLFPLGEQATWRVLATRPVEGELLPAGQVGPPVPLEQVQALLDAAGLEERATHLAWSARVHLEHRLAAHYRRGSVFLAGDAAHTHSPAAAQGMNTGLQDAVNLGWKLAFAAGAAGDPCELLLSSYEQERRRVGRGVLALTHAVFWAEAGTGRVPSFVRGSLAPLGAPLVPVVLGRRRLLAAAIRPLSQLRVHYRRSPLSVEGHPRARRGPRAGERVPDADVTCDGRRVRLHALLSQPGVHVLLHRCAAPLDARSLGARTQVHRIDSEPGDGLVAVRPDGYVGLRCGVSDVAQLRRWLVRIGAPGG